ncbi:MAG: hypothetical protein ABSF21_00930 [Dehalococcoidia bacterium]
MDTSETYIKMCEKAEEIECGHEWIDGDMFYEKLQSPQPGGYQEGVFLEYEDSEFGSHAKDTRYPREKLIWLPRQDQLQMMVQRSDEYARPFIARFAKWVHDEIDYVLDQSLKSMEQLWLAFAMKEKYNKIWNGEEWVNS